VIRITKLRDAGRHCRFNFQETWVTFLRREARLTSPHAEVVISVDLFLHSDVALDSARYPEWVRANFGPATAGRSNVPRFGNALADMVRGSKAHKNAPAKKVLTAEDMEVSAGPLPR
jgi:hypothetical protein